MLPGDVYKRQLLNISEEQMSYITNADAGCGLIKYGSALVPFVNHFPHNTELYLSLIHIYRMSPLDWMAADTGAI